MEEDDKELIELKSLYDELWHDAKTVVKDMRRSISIYLYSALVTFVVALITITYTITFAFNLLVGNVNLYTYLGTFFEAGSSIIIVIFGIFLLRWYKRLGKRYSRLIEMEKELED